MEIVTDHDAALAIHGHDDVVLVSIEDTMTADPTTIPEDEEVMEISRAIDEQSYASFDSMMDEG